MVSDGEYGRIGLCIPEKERSRRDGVAPAGYEKAVYCINQDVLSIYD